MDRHELYGARRASLDETASAIAARLGCDFQERESDYLGVYQLASFGRSDVKIISQPDPEGDPVEDDFEDFATLVYVDGEGDVPDLTGMPVVHEWLEHLR